MDDEDEVEDVSETQEVEVLPRVKTKMKSRPWTQAEEEALVKSYINVSQDPYKGNHQALHSFWKKVLAEFNNHLGKDSLRNHHQVRSKWKDMNGKVTSFAGIYNKMLNMGSGTNNEDVFKAATLAYMKKHNAKNGFPHLAAWDILKSFPKWSGLKTFEEVEGSTSKRARTSESNVRSSETDLMPIYLKDDQCDQDNQDEPPAKPTSPLKRKGKNSVQSSSTQIEELMNIVNEFHALYKDEVEDKKQARAEKLRMKEKKMEARIARDQEVASLVHEQKRQLLEQQKQQDLEFILKSHDQYTGPLLQTVLSRKREIAERWGWDF